MSAVVFAVVATKLTSGVAVVFKVCERSEDAAYLTEALANLGLTARVVRATAGSVWVGMTWPSAQVARE